MLNSLGLFNLEKRCLRHFLHRRSALSWCCYWAEANFHFYRQFPPFRHRYGASHGLHQHMSILVFCSFVSAILNGESQHLSKLPTKSCLLLSLLPLCISSQLLPDLSTTLHSPGVILHFCKKIKHVLTALQPWNEVSKLIAAPNRISVLCPVLT